MPVCAQASGNVAGLCSWAEAMCTYHEVAKEVEPKIAALNLAEGELRAASRERDAALEQLAIVQASLDAMQVGTFLLGSVLAKVLSNDCKGHMPLEAPALLACCNNTCTRDLGFSGAAKLSKLGRGLPGLWLSSLPHHSPYSLPVLHGTTYNQRCLLPIQ